MHWVTSSLEPDTFTDLSLEPGNGRVKGVLLALLVFLSVKNSVGIWRSIGAFYQGEPYIESSFHTDNFQKMGERCRKSVENTESDFN